jgi:hypothetical protein
MTSEPTTPQPVRNRAGIRRTAWILAACAVGSYLVFLFSVLAGK